MSTPTVPQGSRQQRANAARPNLEEVLNLTMVALERLLNLFRVERYIHLVLAVASFLLLLYAGVQLVVNKVLDRSILALLFGASGVFTAASFRTTYFFNKGFKLIDDLIRSLLKVRV